MIKEIDASCVDDELLELFVGGFKLHYNGRSDVFPDMTYERLKKNLLEVFDFSNKKVFVIEEDSKKIGFIILEFRTRKNKLIFVDELYVDEDYRKMGYGKKLMDFAYSFAKENDCSRVELNCWCFNEDANNFYKKLGYKEQRIVYEMEVK